MKSRYLVTVFAACVQFMLSAHNSEAHPGWGVVVDKKGNVYFGDVNRNIIWKIDTKGMTSAFIRGKHSHTLQIDGEGNV